MSIAGLIKTRLLLVTEIFCAVIYFTNSGTLWAKTETVNQDVILTVKDRPKPFIHLEARQTPLGKILEQIAKKTGAIIHYSVLPQEPVTATCAGGTLKTVMECLLSSKVDRIYRKLAFKSNHKRHAQNVTTVINPEEIWILGSRYGNQANNPQCLIDEGSNTTNNHNNNNSQENNPNAALLLMAQLGNDPRWAELRKQALSLLAAQGKTDDPQTDDEITELLQQALTDEDADVRAQAVFGLSQQDSPGAGQALHDAMLDKSADVRLMAVDNAKADSPDGRAILQQALNDSDVTVKAAASYKLGIEYIEPEQ